MPALARHPPAGVNATAAAELFRRAAGAQSAEGLFMLGRLHEAGRGVPADAGEAARLYAAAIEAAEDEAHAMAPFLALYTLRLRSLAAPITAPCAAVLRMLGGTSGHHAAEAADAAAAAATQQQQFHYRAPAPSWDSLLLLALVGALTWVLWRKRQLREQQQAQQQQAQQPAAAVAAAAVQGDTPAAAEAPQPADATVGLRRRPAAAKPPGGEGGAGASSTGGGLSHDST